MYDVYGKKNAWYFLRVLRDTSDAKPWIAYEEDGRTVMSVPPTTGDVFWQTINTTETNDEYIKSVADELITEEESRARL